MFVYNILKYPNKIFRIEEFIGNYKTKKQSKDIESISFTKELKKNCVNYGF